MKKSLLGLGFGVLLMLLMLAAMVSAPAEEEIPPPPKPAPVCALQPLRPAEAGCHMSQRGRQRRPPAQADLPPRQLPRLSLFGRGRIKTLRPRTASTVI